MATLAIFGEKYLSRVAAEFATGEQAREAADRLVRQSGLSSTQVRIVKPNDPAVEKKLEPETRGVARTLVLAHVVLGIAGFLLGLLIASILVTTDIRAFTSNPLYTYGVLAGFGTIGGLLLGGFFTLRPDHDVVTAWVQDAARSGQWFVVVHARDHDEEQRARDVLKDMSDNVVGTL
ncbi:MAG: hypothetical protein RQ736_03610 [Thiogranum sp.]|nr:hypothetical protein [Thiogranum sp.]